MSPEATNELINLAQRLRELEKDAARYQWLRRASVEWSFDNALIASLVRDQKELDAFIPEKVDAAIQSKAGL